MNSQVDSCLMVHYQNLCSAYNNAIDLIKTHDDFFQSLLYLFYIDPFSGGKYRYINELRSLAACRPCHPINLPGNLGEIATPLRVQAWEQGLKNVPDKQFVQYILSGLKQGFRIGFNFATNPLADGSKNLVSALEHPEVIDEYLSQEKWLHHMVVILSSFMSSILCHINPFGVIRKKSKPGKWRLIVDLSSPHGLSVNDGVDKDLCSLSYVSIDHVADGILRLGRGSLMAKVDIKQAYRIIPVHLDDRLLLAMRWKEELIIDKVLPFGLRSAPIIFTAVANALQWIMEQKGVSNVSH